MDAATTKAARSASTAGAVRGTIRKQLVAVTANAAIVAEARSGDALAEAVGIRDPMTDNGLPVA